MRQIKNIGKSILVSILGWQVRRLTAKNQNLKVIAVAGSVGKTSTKLAIAHVLSSNYKVRFQNGNYNDILSVPLIFFGLNAPAIWNIPAWIIILMKAEVSLYAEYNYDFVIAEIGTDFPGNIIKFKKYLSPDLTVLTAVSPEHMEFFDDLDAVAAEELSITQYSQRVLICTSDVAKEYIPKDLECITYGLNAAANYNAAIGRLSEYLQRPAKLTLKDEELEVILPLVSKTSVKSALAAAAVANEFDVPIQKIKVALESLPANPGRMQLLQGKKASWIIDDTYNASPLAVAEALKTLAEIKANKKIAILGSMNELGSHSEEFHKYVGSLCQPIKVDLVVTIGHQAYKFLAPAAEANGCKVERFLDPVAAGEFVLNQLEPKSVVLAKGSQNGVFAEEAIKPLLAKQKDKSKLVRQSRYWITKKRQQFP